jgi:hypothetical protein
MKSNNIPRLCAGAALVASAFGAQAANVTFNGWMYGNGNSASVGAPNYSGQSGAFSVTVTNPEVALPRTVFESVCVDLLQNISFSPTTYTNNQFQVVSGASYFTDDKAVKLAKLLTVVYDGVGSGSLFNNVSDTSTLKDDLSTAMQVAVWNIVYDNDMTLVASPGTTFNSISSYATATRASNGFWGANELLTLASQQSAWTQSIYVLKSSTNQDQIIWTRVPEPASLSLAMLAFVAAGVATRRRKPVQA